MYKTTKQLMAMCAAENKRMHEIAMEIEMQETGKSQKEVLDYFERCLDVMFESAQRALKKQMKTKGGLIDGVAVSQYTYSKNETIMGSFLNHIMALAYSSSEVNASMGRICACPTAGSCGILPAVLLGVSQQKGCDREKVLEALIVAATIGKFYTQNATVAGAEGGCQAECGVAASMAAAAACYLYEASDDICLNAAGFAMINVMGLVCDPVAGLVQLPCAQRNAAGAVNALVAADMAMAGQKALIPFDEVVESMYQVGKMMSPQLRETAKGGLADTPSGRAIQERIFQ